jgi:hypothetical protein
MMGQESQTKSKQLVGRRKLIKALGLAAVFGALTQVGVGKAYADSDSNKVDHENEGEEEKEQQTGGGFRFARVTYVGDGNSTSRLITVGFTPRLVFIANTTSDKEPEFYICDDNNVMSLDTSHSEKNVPGVVTATGVDVGKIEGLGPTYWFIEPNAAGKNYTMYCIGGAALATNEEDDDEDRR